MSVAGNLRRMRTAAGLSQLELALRLGVSQRHVSFVELDRARPSRDLILRWAKETDAAVEERNAALLAVGYSPMVLETATDQIRRLPAFDTLAQMLVAHEPYPALVFDADWMICAMNDAGRWLSTLGMTEFVAGLGEPTGEMDMIAAVAHPGGFLSRVRNAAEVGFALLRQLRAEQLTRPSLAPRVDRLEASLRERFGEDDSEQPRAPGNPHLRLDVEMPSGVCLAFLLVQSVFELPQNVNHASLRIELWFPLDEATRDFMKARDSESGTAVPPRTRAA